MVSTPAMGAPVFRKVPPLTRRLTAPGSLLVWVGPVPPPVQSQDFLAPLEALEVAGRFRRRFDLLEW